jgi:hypothetical protein
MPVSVMEFETEILKLAPEYDQHPNTSRLGCQIVLSTSLELLTVQLPTKQPETIMDSLPFGAPNSEGV